jgi:Domain of unknown function (DUF4189)
MFRKPRPHANRQRAYETRPAAYGQHECELDWPFDYRYSDSYTSAKEAELRPKQVACADCGAVWTMANKSKQGYTTRRVPRTVYVPHPHPHWQGGPVARTEWDTVNIPTTINEQLWVFQEPQAPRPGATTSPDGKLWSDGGKWIPVPGIQPDPPQRRRFMRRGRSIQYLTSPPEQGPVRQIGSFGQSRETWDPERQQPIGAYGAIAYSPSTGRYGWSVNASDRTSAERTATDAVGADDACPVVWGCDAYLALAIANGGQGGWAWAGSEADAKDIALSACDGVNPRIAVVVDTRREGDPRPFSERIELPLGVSQNPDSFAPVTPSARRALPGGFEMARQRCKPVAGALAWCRARSAPTHRPSLDDDQQKKRPM